MTRLRPLPIGNFYCGPSAVATVTGEHPKGRVRALINERRGRPANQGVCNSSSRDLQFALRYLGYYTDWYSQGDIERMYGVQRPTLRAWADDQDGDDDCLFLVNVTGHWVAYDAKTKEACDNHSRIARPIGLFPGNRKLVKGYIKIFGQIKGA